MTRDYVEKLQLISELTPACREALDQGKIGIGQAAALTKLKDPVRQETVLHQLLLYHWTTKELEEYIKDVLKLSEEREAAPAEQVERVPFRPKCVFCGELGDQLEPSASLPGARLRKPVCPRLRSFLPYNPFEHLLFPCYKINVLPSVW
ncbi:hypothetical protein ES708_34657 [subsurface metagenome]